MDIIQERRFQWIAWITIGALVFYKLLFSTHFWADEATSVTKQYSLDCFECETEEHQNSPIVKSGSGLNKNARSSENSDVTGKSNRLGKNKRLRNQKVLNALYNNIKLYDSGVLNYEKKIN